ncbi:MAG TPA: FAD-binding protein [Verrucomicrobiaceae bacterium]|jgi:glycolate oxidase FAD binding subunit
MEIIAAVPKTPTELAEAVRSMPRLIATGANTKPRLSKVEVPKLSTTELRGIVEYEPDEFTFTALAGTPVREIVAALEEKGQYLPFDPMWCEAGATLGGTVASGLSGPGRFRFGGVRDFILGVRFVDGMGRLLRMGGKVVKNAAGFDLPKFFVGSLGRFGALAEITFKVFPRATSLRSLLLSFECTETAALAVTETARRRWECEAVDILTGGKSVLLRMAAAETALDALSREVLERWTGTALSAEEAARAWTGIREFRWAHEDGCLIKIPLTPGELPKLHEALQSLEDARLHVSAGGNVGFLSVRDASAVDDLLRRCDLQGLTLRGNGPLWFGAHAPSQISLAVKQALDPQHRFPDLNESSEFETGA